ncbi:hypothetical protein [Paenibacillus ginsengarvi]|uniref:Uncharacterized protein n=1 Tax=Paenibacillus ginsengarvi TaxID=400777 RepID=A0A3B0CM72_9BACL|nr:hypothetical protein [Paenibacillus ginsengarvi]RKN86050.1 hypothetical protein D7M11_03290 [Paenibacillus ginsengarvi]
MKQFLMIMFTLMLVLPGCSKEDYSKELNTGLSEAEAKFREKDIIQAVASASSFNDVAFVKFRFLVKKNVDKTEAIQLVDDFIAATQKYSRLDKNILDITDISFDILNTDGVTLYKGSKRTKEPLIHWES